MSGWTNTIQTKSLEEPNKMFCRRFNKLYTSPLAYIINVIHRARSEAPFIFSTSLRVTVYISADGKEPVMKCTGDCFSPWLQLYHLMQLIDGLHQASRKMQFNCQMNIMMFLPPLLSLAVIVLLTMAFPFCFYSYRACKSCQGPLEDRGWSEEVWWVSGHPAGRPRSLCGDS